MIWILLPAYNEELALPKLLLKIYDEFKNKEIDFKHLTMEVQTKHQKH